MFVGHGDFVHSGLLYGWGHVGQATKTCPVFPGLFRISIGLDLALLSGDADGVGCPCLRDVVGYLWGHFGVLGISRDFYTTSRYSFGTGYYRVDPGEVTI